MQKWGQDMFEAVPLGSKSLKCKDTSGSAGSSDVLGIHNRHLPCSQSCFWYQLLITVEDGMLS